MQQLTPPPAPPIAVTSNFRSTTATSLFEVRLAHGNTNRPILNRLTH